MVLRLFSRTKLRTIIDRNFEKAAKAATASVPKILIRDCINKFVTANVADWNLAGKPI